MIDLNARIHTIDQLSEGMIAKFLSGWGKVQWVGNDRFEIRYSGLDANHAFEKEVFDSHLCYLPHSHYDEADDCWHLHTPDTSFWEGDHVQYDDGLNCFTGVVEKVNCSLEGTTAKVRLTDEIVTEVPVVYLERI